MVTQCFNLQTIFFYNYFFLGPALFERMKDPWHPFLFFSYMATRYPIASRTNLLLSSLKMLSYDSLLTSKTFRTKAWQKHLKLLLVFTQQNMFISFPYYEM